MADLIVDLSPKQGLTRRKTCIQRSVRFSETSTLAITERATKEELELSWYSKEEQNHQERQFKIHVHKMWQKLVTTPLRVISQEDLYQCVGMERLLSREVCVHTYEQRIIHTRLILAAQRRQKMLNVHTKGQLSLLSPSIH